jgi:hypothetical protein
MLEEKERVTERFASLQAHREMMKTALNKFVAAGGLAGGGLAGYRSGMKELRKRHEEEGTAPPEELKKTRRGRLKYVAGATALGAAGGAAGAYGLQRGGQFAAKKAREGATALKNKVVGGAKRTGESIKKKVLETVDEAGESLKNKGKAVAEDLRSSGHSAVQKIKDIPGEAASGAVEKARDVASSIPLVGRFVPKKKP